MGLDGFSMSNLGLSRNLSSAQLAQNAETTAREALDSQIADTDGVGKKEKAGKKDPDSAFNGHIPFIHDKKEGEEEPQEEEDMSQDNSQFQDDEDDDDDSRYHYRFNANEMIEIWDSKTNSIIRTISPEAASKAILNITEMPGIFINKEI